MIGKSCRRLRAHALARVGDLRGRLAMVTFHG